MPVVMALALAVVLTRPFWFGFSECHFCSVLSVREYNTVLMADQDVVIWYSAIAAATLTLNDSFRPRMGISTV